MTKKKFTGVYLSLNFDKFEFKPVFFRWPRLIAYPQSI